MSPFLSPPPPSQQDTQGRLLVSLTFNPSIGTLDGTIFEANNLTKQDVFGLAGKTVDASQYSIYEAIVGV